MDRLGISEEQQMRRLGTTAIKGKKNKTDRIKAPKVQTAIGDQSLVIEDGECSNSQKTTIVQGPNKKLPTDDERSETQPQARETRERSGCDSSLLNDFLSDDDLGRVSGSKKASTRESCNLQ